jgi:hypothetical protein
MCSMFVKGASMSVSDVRSDRIATARAALAAAEARTGARQIELRGVTGGRFDGEQPLTVSLITDERPPLPVPPELAPLLPEGLRRGAVTSVVGSTTVLLAVLAHACVEGVWAAVVGHRDLGLLAASLSGVPLSRVGLVPEPGEQAAAVLAVLLDGMGVVVVGPQARLTGADMRRLTSRVRERGAALVATTAWPGAHAVVRAAPARWSGVGLGEGRVRDGAVRIERAGRPAIEVSLPLPFPEARLRTAGPAEGRATPADEATLVRAG